LEQFATLARWRAVADYRFPIAIKDKIGGAGIDSDGAVIVIALDHGVNEIVERRQCLTVAQPQAGRIAIALGHVQSAWGPSADGP
jgi:hypothetical protein